ncbi:MAG: hypothetical protein GY948_11785 [Alphaproteobacteria bacterium]|nr:hypothetical protein [Alphaproteobacteria bacterium]
MRNFNHCHSSIANFQVQTSLAKLRKKRTDSATGRDAIEAARKLEQEERTMIDTIDDEPTLVEELIQTARAAYRKDPRKVLYLRLPSKFFEEGAADHAEYFTVAEGEGGPALCGEGMVIQEGDESPDT